MYEDAKCGNPCGLEPSGCRGCEVTFEQEEAEDLQEQWEDFCEKIRRKGCPFCGSKNVTDEEDGYFGICKDCGADWEWIDIFFEYAEPAQPVY